MLQEIKAYDAICNGCGKAAGLLCKSVGEVRSGLVRLGWASFGNKCWCPDCKIPTARRKNGRVAPLLRLLDVGDSITVPIRKWATARSAASSLKKETGKVFSVNKGSDGIYITRTK